jgi:hypothetical protein
MILVFHWSQKPRTRLFFLAGKVAAPRRAVGLWYSRHAGLWHSRAMIIRGALAFAGAGEIGEMEMARANTPPHTTCMCNYSSSVIGH